MTHFWVKFRTRISQNKLNHNNSAKTLTKFCLHKFSPKLNQIWEKRVLNFKFNAFCPVNLNQHCSRSTNLPIGFTKKEIGLIFSRLFFSSFSWTLTIFPRLEFSEKLISETFIKKYFNGAARNPLTCFTKSLTDFLSFWALLIFYILLAFIISWDDFFPTRIWLSLLY